MQLIDIQSVTIGYRRDKPLMDGISFSISRGDSIGILGPNGAGKSTLLKTLLGLVPPLDGRITFATGQKPRLGYVPQGSRPDFAYPLSVLQVALMGRTPQLGLIRRPGRTDRDLAMAQLAAVGLAHVAQAPFRSLSGGQQQRVLVARALTAEPDVLILDEPTSEMDPAAEHNLLSLVDRLVSSRDIAVVFVTHEISAAAGFAESVILLDAAHRYFETGAAADMVSSERMTRLYGRPIEVRREDGRTLVWLSAAEGGVSPSSAPPAHPGAAS